MDVDASRSPLRYLHDVPAPVRLTTPPLPSLLAITLMAVICGEDDPGVVEWADVREDWLASRVRRIHAAQNLARIRRLAMNLVCHLPAGTTKTGRSRKISHRLKRKRCGWVVKELMQARCQPLRTSCPPPTVWLYSAVRR